MTRCCKSEANRTAAFVLMTLLSCQDAIATAEGAGQPGERGTLAYISNRGRDSVIAIDTSSLEVAATVPVGPGVRADRIAIAADGTTAAVANRTIDTVSLIDLEHMAVANTAHIDCPPHGCELTDLTFSPSSELIYVLDSTTDAPNVLVIDAATTTVLDRIALETTDSVGGPRELAISADGSTIYALTASGLFTVDTESRTVTKWRRGSYTDIVAAPIGRTLYAATQSSVVAIDGDSTSEASEIPSFAIDRIAISTDSTELFIAGSRTDLPGRNRQLLFFDLADQRLRGRLQFSEPRAWLPDLKATADGTSLLVLEATTQSLFVVDIARTIVEQTVPLAYRPRSLAVDTNSQTLYISNILPRYGDSAITVVDLTTLDIHHTLTPAGPTAIAGTPDGNTLLVANQLSNEIAVIDLSTHNVVDRIDIRQPSDIVVDARGDLAYIASLAPAGEGNNSLVTVVDVKELEVKKTLQLPRAPSTMALDSVAGRLYVGIRERNSGGSVMFVDTQPLRIVDSVSVGAPVTDLVLSDDRKTLFASTHLFFLNDISGAVIAIDTATKDLRFVTRTGGVQGIALGPSEQTIYAPTMFYLGGSKLLALDPSDELPSKSVELGAAGSIETLPNGLQAMIATETGVATLIDLSSLATVAEASIGGQFSDLTILPVPGPNSFQLTGCMPEFFGRNCGSASGLTVQLDPPGHFADTDGDGIFRFHDLPAGNYQLSVVGRCTPLGICYRKTDVTIPRDRFAVIDSMARCPGDCDGFGEVSINEVISCVSIALGHEGVKTCISCDRDEDERITVGELIQSVVSSLQGCDIG